MAEKSKSFAEAVAKDYGGGKMPPSKPKAGPPAPMGMEEPMPEEDGGESIAMDLIDAIKMGDATGVDAALKAHYDHCASSKE